MKNAKLIISILSIALLLSINSESFAQATGDNNPFAGKFLGFNGPQNLDFKTDDILRMYLLRNQSNTINGWPGIVQNGHLGLSNQTNFFSGVGPASMIHINGGNSGGPQYNGFRPWMKYGTTITSNDDLMYVGHKADSLNKTDAVIAWSDNGSNSEFGPDNLRFIFTGEWDYGGENTSHTEGGQEVMRISPAPIANMGVGNFSSNGLGESPTERVDVDGTARLRRVPNDTAQVLITGVRPDTTVANDVVLNYLEFPNDSTFFLSGDGTWIETTGEDCDWELIENFTDVVDVITGHGTDSLSCYPTGHVGIGITEPQARLDVFHGENQVNPKDRAINSHWNDPTEPDFAVAYGIHSFLRRHENSLIGQGIHSTAMYARRNFAGYFNAVASPENTGSNVGVYGRAIDGGEILVEAVGGRFEGFADYFITSPNADSYGVWGYAQGGDNAYGVYGQASGAGTNWAGYFSGDVFSTTGNYLGSDAILKQNIQPLEGSLEILNQIQPKTYEFQNEVYSQMNLPSGQHQGVIAQELEEVLPNLVKQTTHPAQYDTLGNEISEAVEFKSVNYLGLIPYLIGGIKEQQAEIQQQEESIAGLQESLANQNELIMQLMDQMEMLQQQINGCCNGDALPKNFGSEDDAVPSAQPFGQNELYQNVPNPFRGQTTIRYTLEQGGRAMLNIHDSNGREITQLENAEQIAGTYSYVWDATGLPAGTYHYSLIVDGELLVKRAIKLQD